MKKIIAVMQDGDAVLAAMHQSRSEDKLMNFEHFNVSTFEGALLLAPVMFLLVFIIVNFSQIRTFFKPFMRAFAGLFIKFEDETLSDLKYIASSYSENNCINCGGNYIKRNKCGYCGSTYKK